MLISVRLVIVSETGSTGLQAQHHKTGWIMVVGSLLSLSQPLSMSKWKVMCSRDKLLPSLDTFLLAEIAVKLLELSLIHI